MRRPLIRYLANDLGAKGVRVNGISAGPIKTLAASGIKDFGKLLGQFAATAPLRRNVTIDDVGNAAAFLQQQYCGAYVPGAGAQQPYGGPTAAGARFCGAYSGCGANSAVPCSPSGCPGGIPQ